MNNLKPQEDVLGRTWKNWNPCMLLVEMCNGVAMWENSIWVLPKLKIKLCDPAISFLGMYPKPLEAGT